MIARLRSALAGLVLAAGLVAGLSVSPAAAQMQPVQWNYSFDANNNAVATYPGQVQMTPTGTAQGIYISRALTGSLGVKYWNKLDITSDNVAGAYLVDFGDQHYFGGSAATGTRVGLMGELIQTAPTSASNTSRNTVGVEGIAQANSGDGGTNTGAGALGAYFGSNFIGRADGTNLYEVTAQENDVMMSAGASTHYLFGSMNVNFSAVHGASADAGMVFYSGGSIPAAEGGGPWGPGVGWHQGIMFAELGNNGLVPLDSTATVLGTHLETLPNIPVTNGIDLRGFTFSGLAFASPGYQVSGTGVETISVGNSTSGSFFAQWKPTDYGVGKPLLFVQKDTTANNWNIGLFDTSNNNGSIAIIDQMTRLSNNLTVSTLPAAAAGNKGMRSFVTDATACTFGSTLTGGGAVACPVYSDGAAWRAG